MMMQRVKIKPRGIVFQSRMTQILNVRLGSFFKLVKHIFVIGGSGSGKTSTLLLLTGLYYDNGETIIWRDDTSLEFLSLKDVIPWLVFLPEGCELHYKDPNIEYAYYDPWRLNTLFNQLDRNRGNAVVFDLYTFDMSTFISFWSRFFYSLYKWKRTRVKQRMALITDELNDLAPGVRRGYIPRQLALSSNIYFSMKKFRKEGIRLVASTHAYGDIHKPVREAFNFNIFKKMDEGAIPSKFQRYSKVIERLKVNEMIIVDEEKSFNKMNVKEWVKPKKFSVTWKGDVKKETVAKRKEVDQWKKRVAVLGEILRRSGVTYEQLAVVLGYKTRAGPQQFIKGKLSEEDRTKIEAIIEEIQSD